MAKKALPATPVTEKNWQRLKELYGFDPAAEKRIVDRYCVVATGGRKDDGTENYILIPNVHFNARGRASTFDGKTFQRV